MNIYQINIIGSILLIMGVLSSFGILRLKKKAGLGKTETVAGFVIDLVDMFMSICFLILFWFFLLISFLLLVGMLLDFLLIKVN